MQSRIITEKSTNLLELLFRDVSVTAENVVDNL
jgi:hypothetical protein